MNPFFKFAVRMEARAMARDLDLSFKERRELVSKMTDEALVKAAEQYGDVPREYMVEQVALGDGSILKAIFAWISSPEGQAFIKFIISLFMAIA
jgi:hypothetical protein